MKIRLAALILTKNEEKNITAVVQNARQCADEVVVVDSGSTDRTVEMAEAAGARVVFRAWDNDFSAQRNFALTQTKAEWVLYLDADERLNGRMVQAICKILGKETPDTVTGAQGMHRNGSSASAEAAGAMKKKPIIRKQYSLCRKTVAFGTTFEHGALLPDRVRRFFPREDVRWVNKVHEHPECSLPEEKLPGYVEHYSYGGWQDWLRKVALYTDIWAEDAAARGQRVGAADGFLHALAGLFKTLILRTGFLDGWPGIYMCFCHAFYTMMKYLKLWEKQYSPGSGDDGL